MAEKKVIELEVKSESLGTLKSQLREAQNEVTAMAEKFGATSEQAVKAAKKAAELKDAIGDAKALTDAFNPDAKFNALSTSIGGVLNGFQAFEGALGLVGVEGKAVQETLLKVQSAMALSQGIQGLMEAKDSFRQLGAVAKDVYSNAIKGFQNMTTAGKAFALTGIGLLITGLSLLITYWDDIKKAVGGVSEEEKKLASFRRKHEEERRDFVAKESKGFASLLGQLKATNAGSKERSNLISEINKKYGTTLKNLSDEAAFQNQVNKELENYMQYQTAKFKLQANDDAIMRNLKTQSKLRQEIAQAEKDLAQSIQEGAGKTKRTLEDGVLTTVDVNEKASIAAEKAAKTIRESEKALADAEKRFENYSKASLRAGGEISKLTDNGAKYVEQNKEVVKSTKDVTETIIESTEDKFKFTEENEEALRQMLIDLEAEKDKVRQDSKTKQEEDELMLMQFRGDIYKQDVDNAERAELEKQEKRKANIDLTIKYAQEFGNTMSALNNLLNVNDEERLKKVKKGSAEEQAIRKKMFDREKKMRIAQTIIDTASNIVQSVRNGGGIPTGIPFGVIAAAQGAIQIAAIKKATFGGGEESGGGGGEAPAAIGGATTITPNFNIVGNAQATNPLAGLGEGLIQAYVVSGDVTTAQSLDRNRVNNATFG